MFNWVKGGVINKRSVFKNVEFVQKYGNYPIYTFFNPKVAMISRATALPALFAPMVEAEGP